MLIDAVALVHRRRPDANVHLELVGHCSTPEQLRDRARAAGISDRVHFRGPLPHDAVPDVLRTFTVFAAPSRMESFGVSILEASASGLPVVVSDTDGPAEVAVDGVTGFVVPREDAPAAASAIIRLIDDPELGAALGVAGRGHVEQQYAWQASVDRLLAVYERALASHGVGAARP